MPHVNWLAVLAAALSSFVLGGIWYSALFAKAWQAAAGLSDADVAGGNKPLMFAGAFALSLVQSAVFALFLGPNPAPMLGVGAGFAAGLCWVAAAFGITYLFERRSLKLFAINGGYATLQFTAIGAILGLWH
ncbi:MAG TPA: DUF1761 domain-containing protein [Phenylobacterium sp.]|jgi:hypothetical protein|uniref:DUF1761 domain-containing protein n=1 Tax=Phenylobacterium sp. TaxID=1871053 RepID=UPI002C459B64|nr:DUF1761 domain-containing protein [Phenylobacterium sp.]HXA39296.1 DUF1761 domain-containing protein [Phenylobacterium sp.]